MSNYLSLKNVSDVSRNLLDLPTNDFSFSDLKLISNCRLNVLDLFRDILQILLKIEARKNKLKKYQNDSTK